MAMTPLHASIDDSPRYRRAWMISDHQHYDLTHMPNRWEEQAELLRAVHGVEDPAAKALRKCAQELRDWLQRNGHPQPPPR